MSSGRPPKTAATTTPQTATANTDNVTQQTFPSPSTATATSTASRIPKRTSTAKPTSASTATPTVASASIPPHSEPHPATSIADIGPDDIDVDADADADVDVDVDVDDDAPRRRTGRYTIPTYVAPSAVGDTIHVVADVNTKPAPALATAASTRTSTSASPKLGRPPLPFPSHTPTAPEHHSLDDVLIINTASHLHALVHILMSPSLAHAYHAIDTETINIDPRAQ